METVRSPCAIASALLTSSLSVRVAERVTTNARVTAATTPIRKNTATVSVAEDVVALLFWMLASPL